MKLNEEKKRKLLIWSILMILVFYIPDESDNEIIKLGEYDIEQTGNSQRT